MRFDLTDLRLFMHVVEAESITRGAERAGMSLGSASERIRAMELTGGVPLLERRPRGVRPTPAGQAVAHHARVVLGQLEQMRGELGQYAKGLRGHVRVLANTAAVAEFLPDALASFLSDHPAIDVDLEERPSREIVAAIAGGLADFGIVADTVDLGALETLPFQTDQLVLVCRPVTPLLTEARSRFGRCWTNPSWAWATAARSRLTSPATRPKPVTRSSSGCA
jgi:DNA-binding transcriptional LysR family regulator